MLVEQILERRDVEAVRDDEGGVEGEMGVLELKQPSGSGTREPG